MARNDKLVGYWSKVLFFNTYVQVIFQMALFRQKKSLVKSYLYSSLI